MSVKPIRPNVSVPPAETAPEIIAIIDALKAAATSGVISSIAVTWCWDDEFNFGYAHDGAPVYLAGAAQTLAHQITHEAAFDDGL